MRVHVTLAGALAALALGCAPAGAPSFPLASLDAPLGYPVFVRSSEGRCNYQVQDMIFIRDGDLRNWMTQLSDKGRQIDVVIEGSDANGCRKKAQAIVSAAGFSNVLVRSDAGLKYGGALPR